LTPITTIFNSKTEGREKMDKRTMVIEKRNIILFFCIAFTFIFVAILSISYQKSQAQEVKEGGQVQKDETKHAQVATPQESKPGGKGDLSKEPSPLTEEEQREFETFGGDWETPSVFKNEKEAIKYLKILLKGNEKTIRWYQKLDMAGKSKEEAAKWKKWKYSDNIATALDAIDVGANKEGFKLAVEVLKTRREYPEALARAAEVVKFAHDPSVIRILREIANYPIPSVRLQVAGSLLSLGDADTALPVLEELAEKEGYTGALYYLFRGPGKIIDERGYNIVEKALNNPKAEMRISATKLLLESKKIRRDKAEEIAIAILNKLKDNRLENYGLRLDPKEVYKIIPLSDMKPNEFEKARDQERSDSRACEYTMILLKELKSKTAIVILKYINSNNSDISCICRSKNAKNALKTIEGGKK
jgi:hypothetical protein